MNQMEPVHFPSSSYSTFSNMIDFFFPNLGENYRKTERGRERASITRAAVQLQCINSKTAKTISSPTNDYLSAVILQKAFENELK